MKELSIEEKAKLYDEAKLRMSAAYNSNRCTLGFMNEIFPELKEGEDEKIRKMIIRALHGDVLDMEETTKAINWLEKQDEQKPIKWSEEDKKMFVNIKACLRNANKDYSREVDWLIRLKEAIKPKRL